MAEDKQIYNAYYEDDNENIMFFYTGKHSVIGLAGADYVFKNSNNMKWTRVLFCKVNNTGDPGLHCLIDECVKIGLYSNTGITSVFRLNVIGDAVLGRIIEDSATYFTESLFGNIPAIMLTEDEYENTYGLSVWVDTSLCKYVVTTILSSLSSDSVSIDTDHYPTTYSAEYISDNNAKIDYNIMNADRTDTVGSGSYSTQNIEQRLAELENKTKNVPFKYLQNTIFFDTTYNPSGNMVEDILKPTSVKGASLDKIALIDTVNKTFSVKKAGIYAIQLKNGFYLLKGNSRVDVSLYKGDDKIQEASLSIELTSKDISDSRLAIKNTMSGNIYVTELSPSDKIKVSATWISPDELKCENETCVSITVLQYS